MGSCISVCRCLGYSTLWRTPYRKILMVGLDGAGKTVVLYKLKLGLTAEITTQTKRRFYVENVLYDDKEFIFWKGGGDARTRSTGHFFSVRNKGIIYVIDSADRERLEEAKQKLHKLLSADELAYVPLLILANKQDLPGALSPSEMSDILDLDSIQDGHQLRMRKWHVQKCSAIKNGKGLVEGMEWLSDQIEQ